MAGVAFGLDPSGYSTGKSVLAKATRESREITVALYRPDALNPRIKVETRLSEISDAEAEILRGCLKVGPIAIDVPIDLQGLPSPQNVRFPWELTLRHVDKAFGALPPLADKIGAVTARIRNVLTKLTRDPECRAHKVLETYPAASLRSLRISSKGYKDKKAKMRDRNWVEVSTKEGDDKVKPIEEILTKFNFDSDFELDDDDIDAAICAVTALHHDDPSIVASGAKLREMVIERLVQGYPGIRQQDVSVPENYFLMSGLSGLPKIRVLKFSGTPI